MPCISVEHNKSRRATVRAARIEEKNNRKTIRLTKKQQSAAARAVKKQQSAALRAAKKQQAAQTRASKAQARRPQPATQAPSPVSFKVPHSRPQRSPKPSAKPLRRTAFMTRDDLINAESRLGSTIFGPIPAGHRREFFHDQENIWIWFESWHDDTGHPHQLTVRYEVRPTGIYKKVSAGSYFKLAGEELENFRRATHAYLHLVKKYLYPRAN